MTDKDFVLSVYPDAICYQNFVFKDYTILTEESKLSAVEETESAAWSSAKQYIVDNKNGEK